MESRGQREMRSLEEVRNMLVCDVRVEKESADEKDPQKPKYVRVLSGMTHDLINVEIKLKAQDETLLADFARREEFSIQIGQGKQSKLPGQ